MGATEPTAADRSPPSTRIAMELARETNKGVEELRPLADSVDPEALDDVFSGRTGDDARVTFTHEGYTVTVEGNGDVHLVPANGP